MVLRHIHTQCLDHAAQYSEKLIICVPFVFGRVCLVICVPVCVCLGICVCLYEHVPYIMASKHYYPHASLSGICSIEILGDNFIANGVRAAVLDKTLLHKDLLCKGLSRNRNIMIYL